MDKRQFYRFPKSLKRGAVQIALLYLLIGGLWILLSDRVAAGIAPSREVLAIISIYKGWGYVFVTALLLYWLVQRNTAALQASETQLQQVLDALPVLISYVDKDRRYQFTNKTYAEWFGETVQGKTLEEVTGQEAYQVISEYVQRALQGEAVSYESEVSLPQQKRFIHATYVPDKTADGRVQGFFALVQDTTERKQAEENLHRFELLSEHSRDIILFIRREDARILEANAAALQTYGYSRKELLTLRVHDLRASHTYNLTQEQMAQADGEGLLFETVHARKDGTTFPVEVSSRGATIGGVRMLISIVRDITGRRHAERALRESKERLSFALEKSHTGGWDLDLVDHTAFRTLEHDRIFGYEELLPAWTYETFIEHVLPENRPEVDRLFQEAIDTQTNWNFECRIRRVDGEVRWIWATGGHIFDETGKAYRMAGIVQDITERKQAEERLRKSEERYRYLFKTNPYPMWIYDRETLAFQDVNEAALARYGYSRQEFLSMTIFDIRPPEDLDRLRANLAQPRRPIERSTGWRHRLKDGTIIYVEIISHTIEIDGHESILVVAQDITERRQAEAAAQRYHRILDTLMEGCQIIDFDWHYIYVNEMLTHQARHTAEELLDHTMMEVYPGIEDTEMFEILRWCMKERLPRRMESHFIFPDGKDGWFELSIQPIEEGIFILSTDITERKRIEEELQEAHDDLERKVRERTAALSQSNALLEDLIDNIPDHIYFKDTQSRFIRSSTSQVEMLGLHDPDEIVGKTDFDFFPTHAEKAMADEKEVMRTGKPLVDMEEEIIWPDGRTIWVSTTKMPLRDSNGQIMGIFGISHDITERKQAEQAIQQLNSDLEKQAAQLQSANHELESFSYSVSHDLRAPLRAIDGYTRILVEDYEDKLDDEGRRMCGVISAEARRMGQLIDDLLSFSRLGRKSMYFSRIDMKEMATSIFNELTREEDRERIDFQVPKLPAVNADPILIRQVWTNLLSNAIKFTSRKERAVIRIGTKQSREEYVFYVRDTGAGFDMEYVDKLFGVFQRLHGESEFEGTGVGLAIVQRIIRRHGGRVWAEGEPEKGATFYFSFPRKEAIDESG